MKIKCIDVYNKAKSDLCYDESGAVVAIDNIDKRAVFTVNNIYRDLFYKIYDKGFSPLHSVNDYIDLPEQIIYNLLIPGIAAKIAFDYGDGNLQSYFADIYNQNMSLLNKITIVEDVLPNV